MRVRWWAWWLSGLVACTPAPFTGGSWTHTTYHRVRAGETLYAVAFRYDQDYRQFARYNGLSYPYLIRTGQVLRVLGAPRHARSAVMPSVTQRPHVISRAAWFHQPQKSIQFVWPVRGKIRAYFSPRHAQKGIDIAAPPEKSVHAAAAGVVAYAGNGLIGYGNLIIIKHRAQYFTAYGHLDQYTVKEGQSVKKGQVVGETGRVSRKFSGMHFEIRRAGQPVNPLIYLRE